MDEALRGLVSFARLPAVQKSLCLSETRLTQLGQGAG